MALIYALNGVPSIYDRVTEIQALSMREIRPRDNPGALDPQLVSDFDPGREHSQRKSKLRGYDEDRNSHPERRPALLAQDIMTKSVHHLNDSVHLIEARDQMQKLQVRHIPILNLNGVLVGMLSDRDLLGASADLDAPVSKRMSHSVLTATPDTPIRDIADAMLTHRVHALPITNSDLRMVGILTTTDILRAIVQHAPIELWI